MSGNGGLRMTHTHFQRESWDQVGHHSLIEEQRPTASTAGLLYRFYHQKVICGKVFAKQTDWRSRHLWDNRILYILQLVSEFKVKSDTVLCLCKELPQAGYHHSNQAILPCNFAQKDPSKSTAAAARQSETLSKSPPFYFLNVTNAYLLWSPRTGIRWACNCEKTTQNKEQGNKS